MVSSHCKLSMLLLYNKIIQVFLKRKFIPEAKSIIEKPALLEIAFLPQPSFAVENMLKLRELLGSAMKLLPPPQQLLRIRLSVLHKKDITGFTGRVLMQLAGDEKALQQAAHAKKRLQA